MKYKEEYQWLTNVCLNVTDACNLACRYCFVNQNPHYMTYETAKKAVDFIVNNLKKKNEKYKKNEKGLINFFGGEPLLMWDEIIVPLTNYIRENNLPIKLGITTNGTLLDKDKIDFLYNNNISILLSIDGDRETQEYNRPCHNSNISSFDLLIKNIPYLLEKFPNTTFRATIYAPQVQNTINNYLFAHKLGFKNIFMIPDGRHLWSNKEIQELQNQVAYIMRYMLFCFTHNIKPLNFSTLNETFFSMLKLDLLSYKKIKNPIKIRRQNNRCGLGVTMGSIGFDGKIYGCQEQDSRGISSIFYIGNLEEGINKKQHKKLLKKFNKKEKIRCSNSKRCKKCSLRKICTDKCCPSANYDLYNNFFINPEIQCIWNNLLFNEAIKLNNILVNKNNENFRNFLISSCNFPFIKGGVKNA